MKHCPHLRLAITIFLVILPYLGTSFGQTTRPDNSKPIILLTYAHDSGNVEVVRQFLLDASDGKHTGKLRVQWLTREGDVTDCSYFAKHDSGGLLVADCTRACSWTDGKHCKKVHWVRYYDVIEKVIAPGGVTVLILRNSKTTNSEEI
jgi:hypothetical protein